MISIAYTYLIEFFCLCVVFQVFSITVRWSNNKRFQIYRQYSDVLTLQVCEWMPFHLSVRLAVCPSVHPSVHPPVYLSILLSVHCLFSKLPMYMYMSAIHNTVTLLCPVFCTYHQCTHALTAFCIHVCRNASVASFLQTLLAVYHKYPVSGPSSAYTLCVCVCVCVLCVCVCVCVYVCVC